MIWFGKKSGKESFAEYTRTSPEKIGFIVGTGRCGTTMLAQILNSHSEIVVPPELQFLIKLTHLRPEDFSAKKIIGLIEDTCPYHLEKYFDYKTYFNGLRYPQKDLDVFLNGFLGTICQQRGKKIFFEQTPWYGQHLPELMKVFPQMYIVHIVRDPRDVVFSFLRTPYWGEISFREGLLRWQKEVENIREFGLTMGAKFIEVRYEDMVIAPEDNFEKILNPLGLEVETDMWDTDKLIDYGVFRRGAKIAESYQSREYLSWLKSGRERVTFSDSVYAWKRDPAYHAYRNDVDAIQQTMKLYGYEK